MTKEKIIQISIISLGVLFFLTICIYTIDLIAFKENRIKNNLAKKFCECTLNKSVLKGDFETMDEGFQYASKLDNCYGEEFKKYGKGFTEKQKEAFIEELTERIFKKCPASAEKVFNSID
jgi:hypothetical protein